MKWNVLVDPISDHYEAKKMGICLVLITQFLEERRVFSRKVTCGFSFYLCNTRLCSVGPKKGGTEIEDQRGILPFLSASG